MFRLLCKCIVQWKDAEGVKQGSVRLGINICKKETWPSTVYQLIAQFEVSFPRSEGREQCWDSSLASLLTILAQFSVQFWLKTDGGTLVRVAEVSLSSSQVLFALPTWFLTLVLGNLSITADVAEMLDFYKTLFQALNVFILFSTVKNSWEGRSLGPQEREFPYRAVTGWNVQKAEVGEPLGGNRN